MKKSIADSEKGSSFRLDNRVNNLFEQYIEILHSWNQRTRLTGYRDVDDIRRHLVQEALLAGVYFGLESSSFPIIDFGSGNGTPGVVFAILNPSLPVYLVERKQKKLSFLSYISSRLSLDNIILMNHLSDALEDLDFSALPNVDVWMKAISVDSLKEALLVSKNCLRHFRIKKFGEIESHPDCQMIRKHVITSDICSLYPRFSITVSEALLSA
jgi:16S rRNA (guanine527-N7)-methyltransferase